MKISVSPYFAFRSSSRLSTCACTLTSSADTGSSQMMSDGSSTSERAIEMRWHWPPENWCGWLSAARCGSMPTVSRTESTTLDCSSLVPRFQMWSGSITMSRTLRRGFSEEIGSWKIICMRVRASRIASPDNWVSSLPSNRIEPDVGRGSCMMARPVVDLPQPLSPTMPRVSPLRTSKLMPDTALTLRPVRPTGNSMTRFSTERRTSSAPVRMWAVPVPAIRPFLLRSNGPRRADRRRGAPGRRGTRATRPGTNTRTCARAPRPAPAAAPPRDSAPGRTGSEGRSGSPSAG